jgi:hypothetical protein
MFALHDGMVCRPPRIPGTLRNGDLANIRRAQAREALRAAHVRMEEAHAAADLLRRVRQLRSELQERVTIARDRLAGAKGARTALPPASATSARPRARGERLGPERVR